MDVLHMMVFEAFREIAWLHLTTYHQVNCAVSEGSFRAEDFRSHRLKSLLENFPTPAGPDQNVSFFIFACGVE
jgi:hypothetical protein